jgi:hypothetical protein
MRRLTRIVRFVVVPMAALTILVSSAVPASAASTTQGDNSQGNLVTQVAKPVARPLGLNW